MAAWFVLFARLVVARMREKRIAYRMLVRRPEGKTRLGKPRHRWVDNIKMDDVEIGCGGVGGLVW
jgi:hypothetical protein